MTEEELKEAAKLKEYEVMREEYLQTADHQYELIKAHIVALTALIGIAFASFNFGDWKMNAAGPTVSFSIFVISVIPFEAIMFGFWWQDRAKRNGQIGQYIYREIEVNIPDGVGHGFPYWEHWLRTNEGKLVEQSVGLGGWDKHFGKFLRMTFFGPAIVSIFVIAVYITLNAIKIGCISTNESNLALIIMLIIDIILTTWYWLATDC